jgi:hypothetical protein
MCGDGKKGESCEVQINVLMPCICVWVCVCIKYCLFKQLEQVMNNSKEFHVNLMFVYYRGTVHQFLSRTSPDFSPNMSSKI